jgi:glycosyltransferase involved in cell wall biosynthesis
MRLLCIYQHAPTPGAPGIYRHRLLLSSLVERGWEVDLVSTPVNYMTGAVDPRYARRPYVRETIDGVVHHWVWASTGIHRSKWHRASNYLSFASAALARSAALSRPDVILVSTPPLTVAALGPVLAARFRRPWVLEVRDPWPDAAAIVGWLTEGSALWRSLERLDRRLSRDADGIVVPTPGLVPRTLHVGGKLVRVVPGAVLDAPPSESRRVAKRAELGLDRSTCLFVYTGAVGMVNGLDTLVDAAKLVDGKLDAAVAVVGDGSGRAMLEERLGRERVGNVRLVGAVEKAEVADWLAAADVCLHLLRPDPRLECALPSKILEYFGGHRPVLTTAAGLPRRVAERSGGTFAADAPALAAELERWARMPPSERVARGEQSFFYGTSVFGPAAVVDRLESLLEYVAASGRKRAAAASMPALDR